MRKVQKQEVLDLIDSLHQAHEEIKEALYQKKYSLVQNMLSECQEFAAALGENIEKTEGEGHVTVAHVENYCETLFHVFEQIRNGQKCTQRPGTDETEAGMAKMETEESSQENREVSVNKSRAETGYINVNKINKNLNKQLLKIENSVKNDIDIRIEAVFFPYKASMWDSLESVYLAAKEDPECDAYCVPIPYYDLNPDHSFGQMHYEGDAYPDYIEITDWQQYNFEERKPDIIYIHNPYDHCNLVTSVHPRFYSSNLKKYTTNLVYVPYYSTSGGMSEAQSLCPVYLYADYIVIQASQFRAYFDEHIPDHKFLPFGSPKFDRVVNKCKNPLSPPAEWRKKMICKDGGRKRVFFYNTSIHGMLADTECFLRKMEYVFNCFEGREDVCLLWRPHPLLETTFDSMRPQYKQIYELLKKRFVEHDIGIYDETSDISDTVALCDAYIGDAGTSVTSLFGIVGKPVFILDNRIHDRPGKDSWREKVRMQFNTVEQDRFVIVQGNKLYVSEEEKYDYHYFCDLSEGGEDRETYLIVYEINGIKYACPAHAQEILRLGNEGVARRISLKKESVTDREFIDAWKYDRFLILLPLYYPAIVRYDTVTEECRYYTDMLVKDKDGQKISGASLVTQGILYISSPLDNVVQRVDIESGKSELITIPVHGRGGWNMLTEYRGEIWMLPYEGRTIVRWNPQTGEVEEYTGFPEEFVCVNPQTGQECEEQPFSMMTFCEDDAYLTPKWANMYLRLNIQTGQFTKWNPPFEERQQENRALWNKAYFLWNQLVDERGWVKIYSNVNKRLYRVNLKTDECSEIGIQFDPKELEKHEQGFGECSETLKYACRESIFNSLERFMEGTTVGDPFDKEKQLAAYRELAANNDGSCGRKIYEYIKSQG